MNYAATLTVLLAILTGNQALWAQTNWKVTSDKQIPGQVSLRGYGQVDSQVQRLINANQMPVDVATFQCQSPELASSLIGKLLADLTLSPGVKIQTQIVNARELLVILVEPNLSYIAATGGRTAKVWACTSLESLSNYLHDQMDDWQFVTQIPDYPTFLDRFDRYGWGMYGLGGLSNFHGWMQHATDGEGSKDPMDDLEFLAKYNIRFEPWLDPAEMDNSDGIVMNTESSWMLKESKKRNLPVGMRVYGAIGGTGGNWTDRRFAEYADQPAPFMTSGWHGSKLYHKSPKHMSWNAVDVHRYATVKIMDLIKPYANDPNVMSFMSPYGELRHGHDQWYDQHADYSLYARQSWARYLKRKGYSLEDVTIMFNKTDVPFGTWDQVPVPEFATFAGLDQSVLSLAGTWYGRTEKTMDLGIKDKWYEVDIDDKWLSLQMPGSDSIYQIFPNRDKDSGWFRRSFDWDASQELQGKPLYLYWFPITTVKTHSGENARYHSVYLNGKKAGQIGQWGALEVSSLLKKGNNEIALHLISGVWDGRIYLSTQAPSVYPYLTKGMNQLWMDWKDWLVDSKYDMWEQMLGGMRQVAPMQPIKFMAPIGFGTDRWLKLSTDFGGWPHFTGEGIWFFSWYKRYGYLYGLPATSETAGPPKNLQDQINSYRRVFLAGLSGHDAVFLTQTYTRNPQLRQWWIDHLPVLHQLGRYDIDGPQVLLYRSTRTMQYAPIRPYPQSRENIGVVQDAWNWDIGRGTLQTLGHSYLYLDDKSLADGKMYGYPLMIDSGNEVIDTQAVDHIMDWVKAGGTYVTLPFTGRSQLDSPDTWEILKRTGGSVAGLRAVGTGKVTFDKEQKLFPGFADQSFDDNGRSLDYVGNNYNRYSVELNPGSNGQVIARYENGKAAIVRMSVGRGQIIFLGSAFWRDAEDRMGIWWPGDMEVRFIASLLEGTNFDKSLCVTHDPLIWAQPYRSNNGMDAVTTLVSWYDEQDKELDVELRAKTKPEKLWRISVDGVEALDFDYVNGTVKAKVKVAAKEVVLLQMRDARAGDAIAHWWEHQTRYWKPVIQSRQDLTTYTQGKWEDPTMDLMGDWYFTQQPPDESWLQVSSPTENWNKAQMGILNFAGAQENKPLWARRTFDVPQNWLDQGGYIRLISGSWVGPHYHSKASLYLNGTLLHGPTTEKYNELEVTRLLQSGRNVIALKFEDCGKYIGVNGQIYLYHRNAANRSIPLAGTWQLTLADGTPQGLTVPTINGQNHHGYRPTLKIEVPESWRGKYRIRLYMQGDNQSMLGAYVNDRLTRRHHHRFGTVCDLDITDRILFGQPNIIELAGAGAENGLYRDKPRSWQIDTIRLDLFEIQ